jgi:uncharacterized protein YecE (DUF72 family)
MGSKGDKGRVHVGIGGWTYEPWRDNFYPKGLAQARELEYAARQVTAIEINGTYYGTQKRDSFVKWAASVPDGFVFTVKASRFCTNRKVLAEGGESIAKFLGQGIAELGDKLGPILWQFMATKKFDAADFDAFLALLPAEQEGVKLRHAIQVRHESFRCPEFAALAAKHKVAIVVADHAEYPQLADVTAPFVYARLEDAQADVATGYDSGALDRWAATVDIWRNGGVPDGLVYAGDRAAPKVPRDVYLFMINGAKERAPDAARALLERVV